MKAVFLVHRTQYYRFYTPIIRECLRRRYEVESWHDYGHPATGEKSYSFPYAETAPLIGSQKVRTFKSISELREKILSAGRETAIFSLRLPEYYFDKDPGFLGTWVTLQHGIDSFHEMLERNKIDFPNTLFAAYSRGFLERGRDFLSGFSLHGTSPLDRAVVFPGQPEFDAFASIDTGKVRGKYGIPKDKKILLYLPFPYRRNNPDSFWEVAFAGLGIKTGKNKSGQWLHEQRMSPLKNILKKGYYLPAIMRDRKARAAFFGGINEDNVFRSIREFAKRNDLFLVVKPRLKFPVSDYIKRQSELLVMDDELQNDPPRLKELLSVSALLVSHDSLAVFSAVFAGVPHLNVEIPEQFFSSQKNRFFFAGRSRGFWNYPGVSTDWSAKRVIAELPVADLASFLIHKEKRKEYVREFIGYDDCYSSRRLLELVEKRVA